MTLTLPGLARTESFPSVLADSWVGDSSLGVATSGHAWWNAATDADSALRPVSGKLTNVTTVASAKAGYIITSLAAPVTTIGARFTLGPTTNPGGGVVALVVWRWPEGLPGKVPDSGLHLVCSGIGWSVSVWENGVQSASIGGASFSPALATDSTTVHTLEATVDGDTITIDPPQGVNVPLTDARFASLAGWYPCFEVFQSDASTDTRGAFTEVWAS